MTQLKIADCISDGWRVFKINAGTAIGLIIIYGIITSIGGAIPFVNVVVQLIVSPVLPARKFIPGDLQLYQRKKVFAIVAKPRDISQRPGNDLQRESG